MLRALRCASDIFVLDNALGYVLNQGGTARFGLSYNLSNPYTFPLAHAYPVDADTHYV